MLYVQWSGLCITLFKQVNYGYSRPPPFEESKHGREFDSLVTKGVFSLLSLTFGVTDNTFLCCRLAVNGNPVLEF